MPDKHLVKISLWTGSR